MPDDPSAGAAMDVFARWARRVAAGVAMTIGCLVVVVAIVAMSVSGVALAPSTGAILVGAGGAVAWLGWRQWTGSTAAMYALLLVFAALLVAQQITPTSDVVDPNARPVPVLSPTLLLLVGLATQLVALALHRRSGSGDGDGGDRGDARGATRGGP